MSVLFVHVSTVFLTLAVIVLADVEGLLWIRGRKETLSAKRLYLYHYLVCVGLGILLVTGATLFWPLNAYLLSLPAFYVKMGFVLALLINSFVIAKHLSVATERPFRSLSKEEQKPLLLSGMVSTVSWVGAIVAAFAMDLGYAMEDYLDILSL